MKIRRCELAVPASNWKHIEKAAGLSVDEVFLDLEDSVAPKQKTVARAQAAKALSELDWGRKTITVRINGLHTPFAYRDVIEVVSVAGSRLDSIMIPKVNGTEDVVWVDILLRQLEKEYNINRRIGIEVLIETASGMANVEEIARSSPRIETLIFGAGDYAASVGIRTTAIGQADQTQLEHIWHYPLSRVSQAAKSAGLEAIDGPYGGLGDLEGLRRACIASSTLGFGGKWAIHPTQIPVILEVFSPSKAEVDRAQRIVEAYRKAEAEGVGVMELDGQMIDAASVELAMNVLRRAGISD